MDGLYRGFYILGFHGELEPYDSNEVLDLLARSEHPCGQLLQLPWLHVVYKLC